MSLAKAIHKYITHSINYKGGKDSENTVINVDGTGNRVTNNNIDSTSLLSTIDTNADTDTDADASPVHVYKNTILTWYIAGNNLDAECMKLLCDAFQHDEIIQELWLKRNPIKIGGAVHIRRMLSLNTSIVTLDLHNTGIILHNITCYNNLMYNCNTILYYCTVQEIS